MHIKVWNKKVQYEFDITEKYTILKGDSGTGKTTLCGLVNSLNEKTASTNSKLEILVLPIVRYREVLNSCDNCIVIIDENNPILKLKKDNELAKILKRSNNYFIIIYRKLISGLTITIESMFKLQSSGRYNKFIPLYEKQEVSAYCLIDSIICEDQESSKIFLEKYFNCPCVSSFGKEGLAKAISNNKTDDLLVFYDSLSAGFLEEEVLLEVGKRVNETYTVHPKCFEKYILESKMINASLPKESIENNLEDYYENLLKQTLPTGYSKSRLSSCLLKECDSFNNKHCDACKFYVTPGKKREYLMHSGLEFVKVKNKENKSNDSFLKNLKSLANLDGE